MRAARLRALALIPALVLGPAMASAQQPPETTAPPLPGPDPFPATQPEPELEPEPEPEREPEPEPPPAPDSDSGPDTLTVSWKARVLTGFELTRERPTGDQTGQSATDYGFFLDQARLEIEARWDRLSAEISADLGDAIRPEDSVSLDSPPYLRDAFINVRIKKALRVRAGRFKRPFSRLELISSGILPIRGRGLINDLVVEDARWGDRALGLSLWGKLPAGFNWYVCASNPDWAADADQEAEGLDAHARVVWEATPQLSFGLDGAHKLLVEAGQDRNTNAASFDAELRTERLWVVLDAILAELPTAMPDRPTALAYGAVLFGSYDLPLSRVFTLGPVLSLEYADSDADYSGSSALRAIAGVTLRYGEFLRIMPQVEIVRPLGTASAQLPWPESEAYYVMLAAQL